MVYGFCAFLLQTDKTKQLLINVLIETPVAWRADATLGQRILSAQLPRVLLRHDHLERGTQGFGPERPLRGLHDALYGLLIAIVAGCCEKVWRKLQKRSNNKKNTSQRTI
ncbi:hypothetical protein CEXT_588651 [Caerostris extrusa]|uniref:Uncharacterized protein n=1 Tax=Caerostris extrusa TaxID=172846 RepID=A0AAV4TND9_CAEEX|nr:hypothetical protein CEXT_588651 [Caerostris extrusa]